MKRPIGFLVLGLMLLFVFGVGSCASVSKSSPTPDSTVPKPVSAEAKSARWEEHLNLKVSYSSPAKTDLVDIYTLTQDFSDEENVICEVRVSTSKIASQKNVWLYSIHSLRLPTGMWTYSNETMMIEGGYVMGHTRSVQFTPPVGAYLVKGIYSPFFTYCYPLKDGLPKEVRALIVKPALDVAP